MIVMMLRDLRLAFRRPSDVVNPLVFFAIVATLFPLATSPGAGELRQIGVGVLWVAALLASLLGVNGLFRSDLDDGSIEQLIVGPAPLGLLVTGKILAHWMIGGLPLVFLVPLVALTYSLPADVLVVLVVSLLLATPTISVLVAIGAALTVTLKGAASIIGLLVLPLASPVLVFGTRAADLVLNGESAAGPLYLLASLAVLALTLGPLAAAAAVRVAVE
jgi:heme exporter protein B